MTTQRRLKFSVERINSLPTPAAGKRVEYHDTAVPGLVLRHTASETKTFGYYGWCKAKAGPHRETFGRFPALTVENARRQATVLAAQIAQGDDPSETHRKRKAVPTLAEVFHVFIEQSARPRGLRTVDEMIKKYHRHVERPFRNRKINSITKAEMAQFHTRLTVEAGPTTANRIHSLLLAVFNWAIKVDLAEANPAKGVTRNTETSRENYVEETEMPYFLEAAASEPNPNMGDLFLLCLFTGQRVGTVKAMEWAHLYLGENSIWSIPRTKNGKPHKANLIAPAMDVLKRRFAERTQSRFVFPGTGKSGHIEEPKKGWDRVTARAESYRLIDLLISHGLLREAERLTMAQNASESPEATRDRLRALAVSGNVPWEPMRMDDLRIHDLRRTMGSWLANNHAGQWVIQKVLGHLSPQSTAVYARAGLGAARESMAAVGQHMVTSRRPIPSENSLQEAPGA